MPFDGTAKPDVFSLDGLVAWLEQQPAERRYDFMLSACEGGCLLHRYLWACRKDAAADYRKIAWLSFPRWSSFDNELQDIVARPHPHTFGAALSRARQLLATA